MKLFTMINGKIYHFLVTIFFQVLKSNRQILLLIMLIFIILTSRFDHLNDVTLIRFISGESMLFLGIFKSRIYPKKRSLIKGRFELDFTG